MRFLLANNHCISDPTAGVTQSLRTIVEFLADAGHECRILTTARFESAVTVARAGNLVDGKDMLQLLLLAAECGTELELEATGPDAAAALDALAQILATVPPDLDE